MRERTKWKDVVLNGQLSCRLILVDSEVSTQEWLGWKHILNSVKKLKQLKPSQIKNNI